MWVFVLDGTKTLESRSDACLAALSGHDLAIRAGGGVWPPRNQPEKATLVPARTKAVPSLLPRPSSYGVGGLVGFASSPSARPGTSRRWWRRLARRRCRAVLYALQI